MTQNVAANPCAAPTVATRPTVIIGLGGLAGRVVSGLRKRLRERFGEPAENPGLSILALDTDRAALRALEGSEAGGLASEETLHLPLRKPGDYRSASDEILAWLSRRWLYNIPRSLRTEGLRPLGRLAFVGHREVVDERLTAALTGVTSAVAPGGSPRVYIITSIGGGTGGGMVLDMAYAVRQRLDELRLPAGGVYGILLHATFAASAGNDLRAANAYATLTELNHFMQGNAAYHAGPMAILPAGDVSEPPFAGAYLVDLGDEAGQAEFDEAIERVVEYLYLDVATPAGALLEGWRTADADRHVAANSLGDEAAPVRLRSFGLHTLRFSKSIVAARQSNRLCLRLVRKWLGERDDRQSDGPRIETADFQLADLVARLTALADRALGGGAESHFRTLLAAGPGGPPIVLDDDPIGPYGDDLRRIHALLGPPPGADVAPPAHPLPLERALREGASKLAAAAARSLAESIRELIERPRGRLPAATTAISLLQGHLRDLRRSVDEAYRHDHEEATSLLSKLQRGELPRGTAWFGRFSASAKTPEDLLLDYCRSRLRSMIHKCVSGLSQEVASELATLGDRLGRLRQSVEWLANEFATAHDESVSPWLSTCEGNLAEQLAPLAEPCFVEQFDEALQHELLDGRRGLMGLADESPDGLKSLQRELHRRGCERVAPLLDDVDAWHLFTKANPTAEKLDAAIRSAAETTSIRLPRASTERLLVLMPRATEGKVIADALRQAWPDDFVVPSDEGDLVFCREVDGISLADAASVLVKGRQECAAAARHVLTRLDVSWATLGAG